MNTTLTPTEQKEIKFALKKLKFWHKVLLQTEFMNDLEHRKEFASALETIKRICPKKTKKKRK